MTPERRWSPGVVVVGLALVLLGILAGIGFSQWAIPRPPGVTLSWEAMTRTVGSLVLVLAGLAFGLVLVLIGTGRIGR